MSVKNNGGVISSGDPLTSHAGYEILKAGGNAFDSAIGATLMSYVAGSTLTSAGGGGFMLAKTPERSPVLFDFFTQTPKTKKNTENLDFFPVDLDFGGSSQTFHIGLGSVAVPGNIAGLFYIHKRLGKMPFSELTIPAIEAAKNGVTVTPYIRFNLNLVKPILEACPISKPIYVPDGKTLEVGSKYYLGNFATVLEYLASNGPREFYEGEIAQKIVRESNEKGGHLTMRDFLQYQVLEKMPLNFNFRTYKIFTNPPPSAGGSLIAFMLKLWENINKPNVSYGSREYIVNLINVMQATGSARTERFDDSIYDPDVLNRFLADDYLYQYHEKMNSGSKPGNTTHATVIDKELNIATVTTSFGEGCGYTVPNTDIMLNNMLGEEDLNPSGFHQWQTDQRITSMMSPTIVSENNKPVMALGSGGANRIRTAIVQVIINALDMKLPFEKAVNNGRIHWENNVLDIEPGFDEVIFRNMPSLATTSKVFFESNNMYFGGVHSVFVTGKGQITGIGDKRREGAVMNTGLG